MRIERINERKMFVVAVNNEHIETYPATMWQISSDYSGVAKIECEAYMDNCRVFRKENKYLPITEQDIAALFCADNEEIVKGAIKNEQDYYST